MEYLSTKLDVTCGVPQGSTLGPLLFLLYINDLQNSLKFAKSSHFADDTCLTYSNKNPKTLESNLNYDLKNLTQWIRANRLSLNVDMTKLLIFKSKYNKNQYEDMIIKLLGVRLISSTSVKYLGIHINHNLSWKYHIKEMNAKLSRTNGIISKLRHYVPKKTMVSVYYALFYSHMTYGSLVWSLTTQNDLDNIFMLQKKCIRIINFAAFNKHTNSLFSADKIIKFPDIITLNQLMFVQQFNSKTLPYELQNLLKHTTNIHNHFTRISSKAGLFIPQISSTNFGNYSLKYMAPYVWNNFSRDHPDLCNSKSNKNFLIGYFLEQYNVNTK